MREMPMRRHHKCPHVFAPVKKFMQDFHDNTLQQLKARCLAHDYDVKVEAPQALDEYAWKLKDVAYSHGVQQYADVIDFVVSLSSVMVESGLGVYTQLGREALSEKKPPTTPEEVLPERAIPFEAVSDMLLAFEERHLEVMRSLEEEVISSLESR